MEEAQEVKVMVFIGRDREAAFMAAVREFEGDLVSPGGAQAILRCSRQYVNRLLHQGRFRAFVFRARPGGKEGAALISVADLEEYARQHGKGQPADFVE